jgi:hypothetical protein
MPLTEPQVTMRVTVGTPESGELLLLPLVLLLLEFVLLDELLFVLLLDDD